MTVPTVVLLAGAAAIAYLSVPDTEDPLLVLAVLVPVLVPAGLDRIMVSTRAFVAGAVLAAVALALLTWRGADGRLSVSGWWAAKVVLLAGMLAAVIVAVVGLRTSGRARRSP